MHWVVVETGANQVYVFDSNRMRHVVGASQVVLDAGTRWIHEACGDVRGLRGVQLASGKAVLLVESRDVGREVIRTVTRRALVEAPGLEVTGVVGPPFDETVPYRQGTADHANPNDPPGDHVAALRRTFIEHGAARAGRPPAQLRDRTLPWHQPCRETGLPAACLELFGGDSTRDDDWHPAGAATAARSAARRHPETKRRLAGLLGTHRILVPRLVDELTDDGWIAVVHADGNGVGRIFHNFADWVAKALNRPEISLDEHADHLRRFSERLDAVTQAAFTAAVDSAVAQSKVDRPAWPLKGRLLPILLGGDDVTFACHAALALPLVRVFLREFAARTREDDVITEIAGAAGLTAAAGVAIVKRHHPFSAAYTLAEELVRSAKRAKAGDRALSAYDVHIAHESTLRPLGELRALRDEAAPARHGGPYVVPDPGVVVPQELARRSEQHLTTLMALLENGTVSSARAHELRGALDLGVAEYESRLAVAEARTASEHAREGREYDPQAVAGLLRLVDDPLGGGRFARLTDALLLHGILPQARDEKVTV